MNSIISKTTFFLLPFYILIIIVEVALRNIPNDYSYKNTFIKERGKTIETVILGSSHTYYGLAPQYFERPTFNLAHISQTFDLDFDLLKKIAKKAPQLRTVIIPVSYFSFFEILEDGPEFWRIKNYTIYYQLLKFRSMYDYMELTTNKVQKNGQRLLKYYTKQNKGDRYCSDLGWGLKYKASKSKNLDLTSKSAVKRHFIPDHRLLDDNIKILKDLVQYCNNNEIKVILFTPPAYHMYAKNLDKNQLKITVDESKKISNRFPNCKYYNYLQDKRFTDEDFYDADHLNDIGAKKLSLIINQLVQ